MRIESLEPLGFGALTGRHAFSAGLNVVHGPNEAGKSTLSAALLAGLCGRPRRRGRTVDPLDRYRPWSLAPQRANGHGFKVRLVLRLDAGGRYELAQDLDEPARSKVIDLDLGRDRTSDLLVDRAPDGSRWLDLDRAVVPRTLVVRQDQLAAVRESPDEMQSLLQRAATRGAPDATANQALARIEVFRKERVGSEHASSTRPLKKSADAERLARRALDEARQSADELRELTERARHLTTEAARLRAERDFVRAEIAFEERAQLERRLTEIEAIDQHLASLPTSHEDHVPTLSESDLDALEDALRDATHTPPPTPPAGLDLATLEAELAALPPMPIGDLEPDPIVVDAARREALAHEALERHDDTRPQLPTPGPTRASPHALRALASTLEASRPEPPNVQALPIPRSQTWPWLISGVGAIALGLGLGLSLWWLAVVAALVLVFGVGLGLHQRRVRDAQAQANAAAEASWRRHRADLEHDEAKREEARRTLRASGVTPDPESARRAALELEASADAERAFAQWSAQRERLADALVAASRKLADHLLARDAESMAAYESACRERARQAAESRRRADLERLIAARRVVEDEYARQRDHHTALRAILDRTLARLEVAAWDGSRIDLDRLRHHVETARERIALRHEREDLERSRALLLQGASLDTLRARLAALPAPDPTIAAALAPSAGRRAALLSPERLDEDASEYERTAARLQGELAARRERAPSIAEAEETLARAKLELERVRRLDRDLELATTYLEQARDAVHRDIAPRLAAALTEIVPRLTDGRYRDARVAADTLEVAVRDADGQWRDASLLSHGTAEQLYLALRVVLAQTLAKPGESPPLLFDDITAHADPERRDAMLGWLVELAQRHQVFLFTSDPEVVAFGRDRGASVLELARPPDPLGRVPQARANDAWVASGDA